VALNGQNRLGGCDAAGLRLVGRGQLPASALPLSAVEPASGLAPESVEPPSVEPLAFTQSLLRQVRPALQVPFA
jgi:hypothetical protein